MEKIYRSSSNGHSLQNYFQRSTAVEIKATMQKDMSEEIRRQKGVDIFQLAHLQQQQGNYEEALNLAFICKELLVTNYWVHERKWAIELFCFIGYTSFVLNYRAQAFHHIETAQLYAQTPFEKLRLLAALAYGFTIEQQAMSLRNVVAQAFQLCHLQQAPKQMSFRKLKSMYNRITKKVNKHDEKTLLQLPQLAHPEKQVLVQIVMYYIGLNEGVSHKEQMYYIFQLQLLTLMDGVTEHTSLIFMHYALTVGLVYNDLRQRQLFKQLALQVGKHQQQPFIRIQFYNVYSRYCELWEPLHEGEKVVHELRKIAKQAPILAQNHYISWSICERLFTTCPTLHMLDEAINYEIAFQKTAHSKKEQQLLQHYRTFVKAIRHENKLPAHSFLIERPFHALQLHVHALCNDLAKIEQELIHVAELNICNNPQQRYLLFYKGLALLEQQKPQHLNRQSAECDKILRLFKRLTEAAPLKFEHLYSCLVAKKLEKGGKYLEAQWQYERALSLAKHLQLPFDTAIICGQLIQLYKKNEEPYRLKIIQRQFLVGLQLWGFVPLHAFWQQQLDQPVELPNQQLMTHETYSVQLIVEMMQSLAKTIKMQHLLQQLLQLTLKYTNATASYFIKVQQHETSLTAFIKTNSYEYQYAAEGIAVPPSILPYIDFVVQSEQALMMSNGEQTMHVVTQSNKALSMLCIPVFYKGKIRAVLYLENDLYENAFNNEQLQLLQLISTQIAISLDNAVMYEELERRVQQRTALYEEINHYLQQVNDKLQQHETSQKQLLEGVSHQLRSPITSAIGYIEVVLDDIVSEQRQQQLVEKSKERLLQLQQLIEQLYTFVSYESGRVALTLTKQPLASWLNMWRTELSTQLNGQQLNLSIVNVEQQTIQIDEQKLRAALQALIHYLMLLSEQNMLTIEVSVKHQIMYINMTSNTTLSQQHQLFEAYFLTAQTGDVPMTGVELAICKKIVELHNGSITLEDEQQGKVIVTIAMPVLP